MVDFVLPPADMPAQLLAVRHPFLPRARTQLEAAMADGADIQMDKRYVRADGTRVRTHERVSALRDAFGRPGSLLLVSFDLTDERPGPAR